MQPLLSSDFLDGDPGKPLVLLLGNIDHEGITSSLKSGGEQYKKKVLNSTPENWKTIVRYFDEFTIQAVVIKLNARVYDLLAHSSYKEVAEQLFHRISAARHVVFVFEDLLSGEAEIKEKREVDHVLRQQRILISRTKKTCSSIVRDLGCTNLKPKCSSK